MENEDDKFTSLEDTEQDEEFNSTQAKLNPDHLDDDLQDYEGEIEDNGNIDGEYSGEYEGH
jgi:hypothetical protein